MVQIHVPLWQVNQQEPKPLVFHPRAGDTHQVSIHTVETAVSVARQPALETHSLEIALFSLVQVCSVLLVLSFQLGKSGCQASLMLRYGLSACGNRRGRSHELRVSAEWERRRPHHDP